MARVGALVVGRDGVEHELAGARARVHRARVRDGHWRAVEAPRERHGEVAAPQHARGLREVALEVRGRAEADGQ